MSLAGEPYLSVVVTARNDDHGGNLLGRMQIFVAGWIEQARRYGIPSELIVVEWNPLPDRPRLIDVLRWPDDTGPCDVRFIEVPPELHARYPHGQVLPLYQMAAKNVGIRRARGHFVLATNIDILFSDELAEYLAARRLEDGRMYRIDRHDAMSDVPLDAPLEQQLAYCRTHLIRINMREGSFNVTPDGHPVLDSEDAAPFGSGIVFGRGWYPPECHVPPDFFRWAGDLAELHLEAPSEPGLALVLDVDPGPSTGGLPLELGIEVDGEVAVRETLDCRQRLRVHFASAYPKMLRLRTKGGDTRANRDPRPLNYRVFRVDWERQHKAQASPSPSLSPSFSSSLETSLQPAPRASQARSLWHALMHVIDRLAEGGPLVRLTVPVSPKLRRLLRFYLDWGGVTGIMRNLGPILHRRLNALPLGGDVFCPRIGLTPGVGWLPLDAFRDQSFRRVAGFAELILSASGADGSLTLQVVPGVPAGGPPAWVRLVDAGGRVLGELPSAGMTTLEFLVRCVPGRTQVLRLEGRDKSGGTIELKVFQCGWTQQDTVPVASEVILPWGAGWNSDPATGAKMSNGLSELVVLSQGGSLFVDLETDVYVQFEVRNSAGKTLAAFHVDGRRVQRLDLGLEIGRTHVLELKGSAPFRAYSCGAAEPVALHAPAAHTAPAAPQPHQNVPDFLHTNGCGDFTLTARDRWFDLRGYPEMDLFSMNLDSLFCFAAHYGGAREEMLADPMRIYHIEHGAGSGWTPEGQAKLFERIAAKGLSFVANDDVLAMAAQMRRLGAPMIFNHEDWGLAAFELKETVVQKRRAAQL
jgi:hypothetical protein